MFICVVAKTEMILLRTGMPALSGTCLKYCGINTNETCFANALLRAVPAHQADCCEVPYVCAAWGWLSLK